MIDIEKRAKMRERAEIYYPSFFSNGELKENINLEELENVFLEYCKKYFLNFDPSINKIKLEIKETYDFIKRTVKQGLSKKELHPLVQKLKDQVNLLIEDLNAFYFSSHNRRSTGAKANRANEEILKEIYSWQPFIQSFYIMIDIYFEEVILPSDYYEIIVYHIEDLIFSLNKVHVAFNQKKNMYHELSKETFYGFSFTPPTRLEVGNARKEWRKARNDICSNILYALFIMNNLMEYVHSENVLSLKQHSFEQQTRNFEYIFKSIIKNPNYYCFLTESERKKYTDQNIAYKKSIRANRK